VALYSASGLGLIDGSAVELTFSATPTIDPAMSFAGGALSGIALNGRDLTDGVQGLKGGSLEALFELRDTILPALQDERDAFAADLIARFENPVADPTIVAGVAGLFTDNGTPLDPTDTVGVSGRIAVNNIVDPSQGGDITLLRDGVNAIVQGPVGDPAQIDRWLTALREDTALTPGGATRSVVGHAADFTADVGSRRLLHEERLSFATARQETLVLAELSRGVDTDHELQKLLRIEQIYAANARVVQTIDRMLQRLTEI